MNKIRAFGLFMPILFDSGAGGAGGNTDAEKEAALKVVKDAARDAAEKYVAANVSTLLKTEVKSDDAREVIKQIAQEALDSLQIKESNGRETALKTIIEEMQAQHDKLSATVKALTDGTQNKNTKSFEEEVKAQLTGQLEQLKALKENRSAAGVNFAMKAAGTMLISSNYSGGTVGLTSWDSEFARVQRRQPFMRELVRVLTTDNMYIAWAEMANPDPGVAGMVAEGAAKPQTDFDIVERSAKVEKIAVWIKVSKEALADIKFLQSEINTELRQLVELKIDEQILSGNGTSPNISGILDVAPTFSAITELSGAVEGANKFDVIMAGVAQIAAANFMADTVVLSPADFYSMQLVKDGEGRYLLPPFSTNDGMNIAGLRVVANNGVTAGTFLIGDFKKDNLAIREEINIQIGYVNDDFTKNLVTILAEMRAVNYIKTNHLNAFVQGSFADAIAELEATS